MNKKLLDECVTDTKLFTEKDGMITIEFSVHKDNLDELFQELEKPQYRSPLGRWFATTCETCIGYHGEGFTHVAIEPEKWLPINASNLLKIQTKNTSHKIKN